MPATSRRRVWARRLLLGGLAALVACAPPAADEGDPEPVGAEGVPAAGELRLLEPPAAPGALGPNLATAAGRPLLSWLEEVPNEEGTAHRLMAARLAEEGWEAPVEIAAGDDFFANWADFPAVREAPDGSLLAHWLAKTGEETYAYSIFLARSTDGGETWSPTGRLNDDETPTEHGFVSWVPDGQALRAFWLDGRAMAEGGPMALRTARVEGGEVVASEVLDDRVCECCATDAAMTSEGSVVVYRDRLDGEIRDISRVRRREDGWSEPEAVAEDGWKIPGCPVNGPAVAAAGERAAAAWFTVAGEEPRVKLALSDDGGESWSKPLVLDEASPFGRVDVALAGDGAVWVVWLARAEAEGAAEIRLQRIAADGRLSEPRRIAETSGSRSSGFPRLLLQGERLWIAWVEVTADSPQRVRMAEFDLGSDRG